MLGPLLTILLASTAPAPQTLFACTARQKRITITLRDDRLTYSFGPPGWPEIRLNGGPGGGVYYHRQLYGRGEDQTLRFVNGAWGYVIFNHWHAPEQLGHGRIAPEYNASGLLVMKGRMIVRRINCDKGSGDLHEWSIFKRLEQDDENLTPEGA